MVKSFLQAGYHPVSRSEEMKAKQGSARSDSEQQEREQDIALFEHEKNNASPDTSINTGDERTIWQKCNSFWVWELTTCAISMVCLGVVVWTLLTLDDNPRSNWPFHWEPSSFLSFFVTISRFTMLVGVAEGIAQLRWLYYLGGARRLDHLDSFDSASRGPWGSFLFFCRTSIQGTAPLIARFGALVMIATLAIDTFTQNILEPYTKFQNNENSTDAWVLAANTVTKAQGGGFFNSNTRRLSVYGGLLGASEQMEFNCPSGNCIWPDFTSLGYDITCKDVASTIVRECAVPSGILGVNCTTIRFTYTDFNLSLALQNGTVTSESNGPSTKQYTILQSNTSDSYPFTYKSSTLFTFVMAQLLITSNEDNFVASELRNPSWNLTACETKYSSKLYQGLRVSNGQLTNLQPRSLELMPVSSSECWTNESLQCQEFTPVNRSAVPKDSPATYRIGIDPTPVNIRTLLNFDYNITTQILSDNTTQKLSGGVYNLASGLFWNVNLTTSFDRVATTLTDFLRSNSSPYRVRGNLQVNTIFYNVHWRWFALPAALDLLGPIFLILVIIYTARGVGGEKLIWKTNTIPLLMHGLEGYRPQRYAGAETTGAIIRTAREMMVQLKRNEDGEIRFVRA